MIDNKNLSPHDDEHMSNHDFNDMVDSLDDEELQKVFTSSESKHASKVEQKKTVTDTSKPHVSSNRFNFDLHGKSLLESDIQPFMYENVPMNIIFNNMMEDLSSMYLKYVLTFLIMLFIVLVIL